MASRLRGAKGRKEEKRSGAAGVIARLFLLVPHCAPVKRTSESKTTSLGSPNFESAQNIPGGLTTDAHGAACMLGRPRRDSGLRVELQGPALQEDFRKSNRTPAVSTIDLQLCPDTHRCGHRVDRCCSHIPRRTIDWGKKRNCVFQLRTKRKKSFYTCPSHFLFAPGVNTWNPQERTRRSTVAFESHGVECCASRCLRHPRSQS